MKFNEWPCIGRIIHLSQNFDQNGVWQGSSKAKIRGDWKTFGHLVIFQFYKSPGQRPIKHFFQRNSISELTREWESLIVTVTWFAEIATDDLLSSSLAAFFYLSGDPAQCSARSTIRHTPSVSDISSLDNLSRKNNWRTRRGTVCLK